MLVINREKLVDFYTQNFLLSQFCENNNLPYLFFSAAKNTDCPINCFPWLSVLNQVQEVTNNTNIFKLHDFCIQDWANKNDPNSHPVTGHLSSSGHSKLADFLFKELNIQ